VIPALINRITQAAAVILVVATLTFAVTWFGPGDIATQIALARYDPDMVTPEIIRSIQASEGLDRSGAYQFAVWLGRTATMDLGRSLVSGREVSAVLGYHFQYTLKLALAAMTFSLVLALPLGIASGLRPGSKLNLAMQALSSLLASIPAYILAIVLILIFAVHLSIFPVAGFSQAAHIVLPALTLGLGLFALSNRLISSSINMVREAPFYLFAKTKGLPRFQVLLRHGMPNAAAPILTFLGLQFAFLLDGVIIVENIFAWPGIGHLLLESILARDIPVIQGTALAIGLIYVSINAAVDLVLLWLNPASGYQDG